MEMSFGSRLKHAWNAFTGNVQTNYRDLGMSYSYRADRPRMSRGNERSIVTSVYNRIALDVAALNVQHVRLDENGRFLSVIDDGLNNCLTLEANVDQTARSFIQDVVISMFDEGSVAIVPVDTTTDPNVSGSYDIQSLRVGQILDWYPQYIRARVYNEQTGRKEDIVVPKSAVAIIENPLYAVINEPNSTMQRLIRKLNLLDVIDEQSSSGKLDLIIQLPYIIKTEARRQQAENRRKDIEQQLSGSKYGIAYTDGTEHITQLNRSVNNNLMSQIEFLTSMLYSQLGITQSILDGTADEKTMLNYNNRTIEPIVSAIVDEMKRKFLTKTARSQLQSIAFFRDPFKLVPVNDIAEIADKFTRNEIMTSNEIRQVIGMKPSDDPRADELRNKNLSAPSGEDGQTEETSDDTEDAEDEEPSMTREEYEAAMRELDELDLELDELEAELDAEEDDEELKHYASPYYDPVKAHEYYLKNRELKGRRSTAGLNDEGKNAARYVKEQLTSERKQKVEAHKQETNSTIDSLREQKKSAVEAHKNAMQVKIDRLRAKLKGMSKEDKARNKERIYGQIDSLREDNKQVRQQLQEAFKASSTDLRSAHKEERTRLKNEYDEKYLQELDKIRSESKFKKVSKRKSKK
jgi:hypothetical protein